MMAKVELAQPIQLVLLAMLKPFEEAVAERDLGRKPGVGLGVPGIPSSHEIGVAIVAGDLHEAGSSPSWNIGSCQIDGVVAFTNIEGAAVDGDSLNDRGYQEIGIGVAISVSVSREVVGVEIAADLKELSDGLAVITRHSGGEVLWRFNSTRRGFDGQAG